MKSLLWVKILKVFFSLLLLNLILVSWRESTEYNVLDYGAKGDGITLNTIAINQAITDCSKHGGGTVVFPEGVYLTGTISLESNVNLYLEYGSVIRGTSDLSQYISYIPSEESRGPEHFKWNRALILGDQVENITISGPGAIDGDHVFDPEGEEGMRGPHAMLFGESRDIQVKDITWNNAANYAFMAYHLENATFSNLTFNAGWDGIHIRRGRDLKIEHCTFHTGDDAIAGGYWENMEITDNQINSSCNGIRLIMPATNLKISNCLFFGDGKFEHRSSREKMRKNMLSAIILQPGGWGKAEGMLENVSIREITIDNVDNPIMIILNEGNQGKGITIENVTATRINKSACSVESWKGGEFEDVTFKNVHIEYQGHAETELAQLVPGQPHVDARQLPCWALFARNINHLVLDGFVVDYTGTEIRPACLFENIQRIDLKKVQIEEVENIESAVFINVDMIN